MVNISKAAGILGRKGGRARVPKGFSMLTPAARSANGRKAAIARWGKKRTMRRKQR